MEVFFPKDVLKEENDKDNNLMKVLGGDVKDRNNVGSSSGKGPETNFVRDFILRQR